MKKVLALVLAGAIAASMTATAFAHGTARNAVMLNAGGSTATLGVSGQNLRAGGFFALNNNARDIIDGSDWDVIARPTEGSVSMNFTLNPAAFVLENQDNAVSSDLRVSQLRSSHFDVQARRTTGFAALRDVSLQDVTVQGTRTVNIRVRLIAELVNVNDQDFEYEFFLTHQRQRIDGSHSANAGGSGWDTTFTVFGNLDNDRINVFNDDDTIWTGDGVVVEADTVVRGITLEAGAGVEVTLNMNSGAEVYVRAHTDLRAADSDLMDETPELAHVIYINSHHSGGVNLRSAQVALTGFGGGYYVYNNEGTFIGMSNQVLPFSSVYYLATARIDNASVTPETLPEVLPEGEIDATPGSPETGGDGWSTPPNVNDNPGTGR